MFSKTSCPYCVKAKQLLSRHPIKLQVYELDTLPNRQTIIDELSKQTGINTVPNIFVFGTNIGGYTELKNLSDTGKLQIMISSEQDKHIEPMWFGGFDDWGAPI
jgi:glutaredoxin